MHPLVGALVLSILVLVPIAVALWYFRWKRRQFRWEVLDSLAFFARRGLPLTGGLKVLRREWGGARGERVRRLAESYQELGSLGDAMEVVGIFPPDVQALVRVGEDAGGLPAALEAACLNMGGPDGVGVRAFRRLFYPIALVGLVFLAALFAGEILLPRFSDIAMDQSRNVATWHELPFLVLESALVLLLLVIIFGSPEGLVGRFLRSLMRRLPIVRGYARARDHARWLTRVAGLIEAGATLPAAFAAVADLTHDAQDLRRAAERAEAGGDLAAVLSAGFGSDAPRLTPRILLTTQSHELPNGLRRGAEMLRVTAERRLGVLGTYLEPLPTILCGAVVGSLAVAVFAYISQYHQALMDPLKAAY